MSASGGAGLSADLLKFIRQGRSFSGHEPHCVFLNTHAPRFADVSAACGLDLEDDGRAVGQVDWDHDGDLDLWLVNRNGPQVRFMRNSLPRLNHFVAIRLRGTKCNRDAIGARVEIVGDGAEAKPQVRSLRAGDGYLAQSSKWLHFGLAQQDHISQLIVKWPDGSREEFRDVAVDQRYLIEQGTGRVEPWKTDRPRIEWVTTQPIAKKAPTDIQVLSLSKLPLPMLPYRALDGTVEQVFRPGSGKPVLLNLWAPWCQPCLIELAEMAERQGELRAAGLDVVALSVGDGNPESSSPTDSRSSETRDRETLERLGFPFRVGIADARLVQKMQLVNNMLFDLHLPLPVPTSMLIDGHGRLAAIYKGRLSVDRLLQDVALIDLDNVDRRTHSVPFPGRWHEPLNDISLIPLLHVLISEGFLAEADDFVRRLPAARKEHLLPELVRLGMAFYRQGDGTRAKEHFAVAVKIDPTFAGVETALGRQRQREGRPNSAKKLYREALRRNPQSVTALNNLAWLLATHPDDALRDGAEAVRLAETATELTDQKDPAILDTLSAAYAERGDFPRASNVAQKALEQWKSQGRLQLADEVRGRITAFEQGRPVRQK